MPSPLDLLRFRCTSCGNCCKDPLLPLTDADVRRITERTGDSAKDVVRFVDRNGIDMDDEPESFAILRHGKRVMVLRHRGGGCRYLDAEDRCSIYGARPLGCRIFPFDPVFDRTGKVKRLNLIPATDCRYALDGSNDMASLKTLHERYESATREYRARITEWNSIQRARRRKGREAQSAGEFLAFLGLAPAT